MSTQGRRKVAVLGGGQAALTAALQLTDPDNPQSAGLEVTIYQLGWRLGGKGATGRPPQGPPRILEHGLHNWFGFYDNSIRQIKGVYDELDRPPGAPMRTFHEAFEPASTGAFYEWIDGNPLPWEITNPTNPAIPGEGGLWLTPLEYIAEAVELIERIFCASALHETPHDDDRLHHDEHLLERVRELAGEVRHGRGLENAAALKARHLLRAAVVAARAAADGIEHPVAAHVDGLRDDLDRELPRDMKLPHAVRSIEDDLLRPLCVLLWLCMAFLWLSVRAGIGTLGATAARRLWIQANFGYACVTGAIRDDVVADGFDVLNDRDLRAWLKSAAFPDGGVMLNSPLVEAIYSGSFAYPGGDTHGGIGPPPPPAENLEAGSALRGVVRSLLTYKGAFAFRFNAGTADTCYAPAYEVLRRRGVQVRFFSNVQRLDLEDGRIVRVHVDEQAQIAGDEPYWPLVDVDGLPCWPLEPRWEELVDGDWFREQQADFEWPSEAVAARARPLVLEAGADFDDVVLGISIAALPPICADLVAAYPAWGTAFEQVQTVCTQGVQVWLEQTSAQLGFPLPGQPITGWRYDEMSPLNVWGDFSELIAQEHWPADATPLSLGYLTSTMQEDATYPFANQAQADDRVRELAVEALRKGLSVLMPELLDGAGEVRWDVLADWRTPPGQGIERLDAQWFRGNVRPTERYVLTVVGSSQYRLAVHDAAGPANLYLSGDWTQCTLNVGCMEAATMSGMLCANALCGYPTRDAIVGVDF